MDAIITNEATREEELMAIARMVMYAQAAARDLAAKEVEDQLSKALEAIIFELDGVRPSDAKIAASSDYVSSTRQ